jgi:hypothetical protein
LWVLFVGLLYRKWPVMTSAATLGHIAFGYPSLTARHCVFCTHSRRWLVTGI